MCEQRILCNRRWRRRRIPTETICDRNNNNFKQLDSRHFYWHCCSHCCTVQEKIIFFMQFDGTGKRKKCETFHKIFTRSIKMKKDCTHVYFVSHSRSFFEEREWEKNGDTIEEREIIWESWNESKMVILRENNF